MYTVPWEAMVLRTPRPSSRLFSIWLPHNPRCAPQRHRVSHELHPCYRSQQRHESTALDFYQNRQLEIYAGKEAHRVTLRQLVFYGRHIDEERLLKNANYVREELPVRLAKRLRDIQKLPYIVVTQEGINRVYEMYWDAFEQFRKFPEIKTIERNIEYCRFLTKKLDEHAVVIPNLALGLSLSSPHLHSDELDSFMRRMLVSRISRRVLAEHHIALTNSYLDWQYRPQEDPHVGIIFTGLDVRRSTIRCVELLQQRKEMQWPEVIIDGHTDVTFSYIREHLEYIVFELLKNSLHATINQHKHSSILPPVCVTVVKGQHDVGIRVSDQGGGLLTTSHPVSSPADLFSFSHTRNAIRMDQNHLQALRRLLASDQGVKATVAEQVKQWGRPNSADTDINLKPSEDRENALAHIGIGLPMSKIFATYFGGSLELVSLDGWGTDAYVRLPKLGTNLEGIEL